jgi:hypothetical protein
MRRERGCGGAHNRQLGADAEAPAGDEGDPGARWPVEDVDGRGYQTVPGTRGQPPSPSSPTTTCIPHIHRRQARRRAVRHRRLRLPIAHQGLAVEREPLREEASLLCLWILPHTAGKREEERELPGCRERGRMTEEAGLILIYFFMFMNKCLSTFLYLVKHLSLTVFMEID